MVAEHPAGNVVRALRLRFDVTQDAHGPAAQQMDLRQEVDDSLPGSRLRRQRAQLLHQELRGHAPVDRGVEVFHAEGEELPEEATEHFLPGAVEVVSRQMRSGHAGPSGARLERGCRRRTARREGGDSKSAA